MNIRSVSDLRNHYTDVGKDVENRRPAFLTKNGRGSIAAMSFDQYQRVSDAVEQALDVADRQAQCMSLRYSHEEIFDSVREMLANGETDRMA